MAGCPRLTELTVFYPHPDNMATETGIPADSIGSARFATLELVHACKALPDFDTLQIVHFLGNPLSPSLTDQWDQALRDQAKDWIDCLKKTKMGCQEEVGRKKSTLRVIQLSPDLPMPHLGSVKVEVYEV
jgi:hypothetical protein